MRKNKCVYIVSGYMRSGTSMMMKCLSNGGMSVVYNENKNQILNKKYNRDDYQPNPEGFFELGRSEFESADFPHIYTGKLIKVLHWRLAGLPEYHYRIVFMTRDPKEIEVSYLKMFQRRPPFVLHKYDELLSDIFEKLDNRNDIDVIKVNHRQVIDDPESVFSMLQKNNWPITDINKSINAVNKNLYRSKKEDIDKVRATIPGLRTDLPEVLKKR